MIGLFAAVHEFVYGPRRARRRLYLEQRSVHKVARRCSECLVQLFPPICTLAVGGMYLCDLAIRPKHLDSDRRRAALTNRRHGGAVRLIHQSPIPLSRITARENEAISVPRQHRQSSCHSCSYRSWSHVVRRCSHHRANGNASGRLSLGIGTLYQRASAPHTVVLALRPGRHTLLSSSPLRGMLCVFQTLTAHRNVSIGRLLEGYGLRMGERHSGTRFGPMLNGVNMLIKQLVALGSLPAGISEADFAERS